MANPAGDIVANLRFPGRMTVLLRPNERKSSAVLSVDVAGYSRLMEADEEGTHAKLMQLRSELLDPTVHTYAGRIVKHTGDGFLAAFDNTEDALRCAVLLQETLRDIGLKEPSETRIAFRMGMHVCNTIVEKDDIYGDGVNIAARLHNYAEPGDIVVSAVVAEQAGCICDHIPKYDLGDVHLKNLTKTVRATGLRIGSLTAVPLHSVRGPPDDRPSLAVLPFRKVQPAPDDGYFADGVVEEIIHALAGLKELFVISRTSTLRYTGPEIDVRMIGRELGVRYILYGSIRRSGRRIRISTELSDVGTGHIIDTSQYDSELEDLFDLQARISAEVLKRIAPHLRESELRRVMRKHPESLTAYDLVLQGLDFLYKLDYESHSRARGLLQQAISQDPSYAPAYTYTAYWHIFRVGEGWSSDPDLDAREAARIAKAATERDPNDALALAIYGHIQSFLLKDYDTARAFLDRAIEVGPNCANAWTMSSATHGYIGNGTTAIDHAEHGLRISPLDAHVFWHEALLAQAYYINGQYDEAVTWARKAAAHNASAIFNLRTLAASLVAIERLAEARDAASRLLRIQAHFSLTPYAERCPFIKPIRDLWIERLRLAGFPG